MEEHGSLDIMQAAYRKDHNVTQSLLSFLLSTTRAFKKGEPTVVTYIDFEGAFHVVWRDGAICMLYEAGIEANMLLYVASFLQNRQSHSIVNVHITDWKQTHIGVPQGSVVAPLIFIQFITKITKQKCAHIGYADDLTLWTTDVDAVQASAKMQESLETLAALTMKW